MPMQILTNTKRIFYTQKLMNFRMMISDMDWRELSRL